MPFSLEELREYLATDATVRILIVEGRADVAAWQYIIPTLERRNCVVYSVDEIDVPVGHFGKRGSALQLAQLCAAWPGGDRIRFFLDADNDRHLGIVPPNNVVFTDFRDLEAYALLDPVFKHLCMVGAGESNQESEQTREASRCLLRPIGLLRIASDKNSLKLPFQQTFLNGTVSRFFKKKGTQYSLVLTSLFDAIVNKAGRPNSDRAVIFRILTSETEACEHIGDCEIIHGKDFVAFLAWYFNVGLEIASGLIHLAIGARVAEVRQLPNIDATRQWLLVP